MLDRKTAKSIYTIYIQSDAFKQLLLFSVTLLVVNRIIEEGCKAENIYLYNILVLGFDENVIL